MGQAVSSTTMVMDAEQESGPKWSGRDDPRVTKLGRIMRKLRFDELPQLISILKGEMSFVGPRPIRKHFADILSEKIPFYRLRFLVKPGLTGWAQVKYDYAGSDEGQMEKLNDAMFQGRESGRICCRSDAADRAADLGATPEARV